MNWNVKRGRAFHHLENTLGVSATVLFNVRLFANGPVHIDTVVEAYEKETMRVALIRRANAGRRVGIPIVRRFAK